MSTLLDRTPASYPPLAPQQRGLPSIGSIVDFRRDILSALGDGQRRHGDLVRYRLGPVVVHGVTSPELAEEVLTDSATYGKLGPENPLRLVLGTGLLTSSDHESWLRNRRMMQPVFHRANIDGLFDAMSQCTQEWLARLSNHRSGDALDLHTEMMRVTLDIVSRCMFSTDVMDDLDRIGPHAVDTAVNYAFSRLQNPFSPPTTWPTLRNLRFQRVMRSLDEMMYGLIAGRRAATERRGDLLDMLLAAEDADTGERMSDRELRDEIITMFAAGHETTAITLTWTWYLLSQHPEVLRRLQAEVDTVLAGRIPGLRDLPDLPYTLAVFEESMRLFPSAPIVPRLTTRETVLGGHRVPAGSRMLVSLFHVQRHPRHWTQPEVFDPDRFTGANRKGRHRFAYIPFGAGPHLCIGKHFALLEAQLILAALAARFEFRHVPGHRVSALASITLRPRHGMQMTIRPRPHGEADR